MSKYRFFTERELACSHCGECFMDDQFMTRIDCARGGCDFPWPIRSGYRCDKYDKKIGGEGNHPTGQAIDIGWENSEQLARIVEALSLQGFKRMGISFKNHFIHVDSVPGRPTPRLWGY